MFDDTVLGVNGNKPPECNGVNAKNKELNSITSQPRCWLGARLHKTALLVKTTVYALKQALLDAYLCKQLRYLAFAITSA